jgi:DNA-binding Xre family transcriptional regulator
MTCRSEVNMTDVGKCLRVAMARQDMTSAELARLLSVTPQQVVRWRKAKTLKLDTIEMILYQLDLDLEDFVLFDK